MIRRMVGIVLVLMGVGMVLFAQQTSTGPKAQPVPGASSTPSSAHRASGALLVARPQTLNFDSYYRFPLSFGVTYQSLFPLTAYPEAFSIYQIAGDVRWPLPKIPLLQPAVRFGFTQFSSQDTASGNTWSHSDFFASGGVVISHRFSKLLGAGLGVFGGYDYSSYPNLSPTGQALSSPTLIADAVGLLTINPFFNLSINVQPTLRYEYSLSALTKYNGLLWGIGATVNLRLGSDPDSAQSLIRSIRFGSPKVPTLFAAMQSYYVSHPVGSVKITNIDKKPITDVEVSFYQKGYMDSPTPATTIKSLAPGASRTVKLPASFNSQVFTTEGATPLTGEVEVSYYSGGKAAEQSQAVTYDLEDKTALTWDDGRKVGAFITPADSTVRDYASFVRQADKTETVGGVNEPLQTAMQIYAALSDLGILYQPDPVSPFTKVQSNTELVDSINFARDTLKRTTGDCDDLTVLFDTVLETVGIETGYILVPGHIFAAFNTGVPARQYKLVHPDRSMTLAVDGQIWVPVEITLMGRGDFMDAWRTGMAEYSKYLGKSSESFTKTHDAQLIFRPVALKQDNFPPSFGNAKTIAAAFARNIDQYSQILLSPYRTAAKDHPSARNYNILGIESAKLKRYADAENALDRALKINTNYLPARINLGSLEYLQGKLTSALGAFLAAEKTVTADNVPSAIGVKVELNISKTLYDMKQYDRAQSYYEKAVSLDAAQAKAYSYLAEATTGSQGARAAEAAGRRILFVNEE